MDLTIKKYNGPLHSGDGNIGEISVYEICFVYEAIDVYEGILGEEFLEIFPEDFAKHDIRPTVLLDLINDKSGEFRNVVVGK